MTVDQHVVGNKVDRQSGETEIERRTCPANPFAKQSQGQEKTETGHAPRKGVEVLHHDRGELRIDVKKTQDPFALTEHEPRKKN